MAGPSCCNDLVSCAAAVASNGVTCLIELAREALRSAVRTVERTRDEHQALFDAGLAAASAQVEQRLAKWREVAERAAADLDRYAAEAARLVADDTDALRKGLAAASAAGVPHGRTETSAGGIPLRGLRVDAYHALLRDDSLSAMRRRIERERQRGHAERQRAQAEAAEQATRLAESNARLSAVFAVAFGAAVATILLELSRALANPLKVPTAAAGALAALATALKALDGALPPAQAQETGERTRIADVPRPYAERATQHALRAEEILRALRRAARVASLEDRELVARALTIGGEVPASAPDVSQHQSTTLAAAFDPAGAGAAALESLEPVLRRLCVAPAPAGTDAHRARVAADLDRLFAQAPAAEAREELAHLLDVARRRHGDDHELLAGIEALLLREARARGVL